MYEWLKGMKWPYFVNWLTTIDIVDFPWDLGKPSIKFIETSAQTLARMGNGCKRPDGFVRSFHFMPLTYLALADKLLEGLLHLGPIANRF
jgi:hypothetical protein